MVEAVFEVLSKAGKRIRLTRSVWYDKILVEHPELGERDSYLQEVESAVNDPDYLVRGWAGELLALRWCETAPKSPKFLCVVFRELNDEGFVITAFFISRYLKLLRRETIWRRN